MIDKTLPLQAAADNPETPSAERQLELYRLMKSCRVMEQRIHDLFMQNLVKGTSHLAIGQEAIAAGFAAALREDDYSFCTYRGHNHTLLRGVSMTAILGEMMGRECGLLKGKGGSMHLMDVEKGAMGSYAIIGAHMPIAAGAAWSAQYRKSGQIAVCFFGDGTTNIGAFHEAINFAAIWKLPVVFVCENNLYMEYTAIADVTAVPNPAADRASAYGLEPIAIDGNDVELVHTVANAAVKRARDGDGPSLIEAKTYRHGGHSRADPGKYRPDEEVAAWKARDPVVMYRAKLLEAGVDEGELNAIDQEQEDRIDRAEKIASESGPPPLDIAETDLWSDGSSRWRN